MNSQSSDLDGYEDKGVNKPIPSFDSSGIKLSTIGIGNKASVAQSTPDYLEYDNYGRGLQSTLFSNAGLSYVMGTLSGGLYGLNQGLQNTPSDKFRVKLNSILNHSSKYGSRVGNMIGAWAVMYTMYEWGVDQIDVDQYTGPLTPAGPAIAAFMTGATYKSQAGPRVAGLAGIMGLGAVGITYTAYSILGIPYGQKGFIFF